MIWVKTHTIIAAVLGGALILAASAGCGTTASTTTAAVPASASAPAAALAVNPVPLIRQAGATPDPGTAYGTTDLDGWRTAEGTFPGTGVAGVNPETILVFTLPGWLTGAQAIAAQPNLRTDDNGVAITGPHFYAAVRPAYDNQMHRVFPVSPAAVAQRLGGHVQPGR